MIALGLLMRDLDRVWPLVAAEKLPLHLIGSTALLLQTDYFRATKDSDVIETNIVKEEVKLNLLRLAGKDSAIADRHRLYIDVVHSGLPFLPQVPVYHELTSLSAELTHFGVAVLDVVDVVVSKLKPFRANDQADIKAMVERDLIDPQRLLSRFRDAVEYCADGANGQDIPGYIKNLNRVQRDYLGVAQTPLHDFALPDWL